MAFGKICACGKTVIFERRFSFPEQCPECGRRLIDFPTKTEEELEKGKKDSQLHQEEPENNVNKENNENSDNNQKDEIPVAEINEANASYVLRLEDGNEICIPDEGGIIGRTEIGAEILAPYNSVSRKHIKVIIRRKIGVMIEDLSSYGTLINGQRIERNVPTRVQSGAVITLCNLKTVLTTKEINE